MSTVTVAIDAAAAAFTAVAAGAAWRSAVISRRDAEERSRPFVSVGMPSVLEREYIVPVRNLGLGPAHQIAMQIMLGEQVLSTRIDHGLAPMEVSEWVMPVLPAYYAIDEPLPPGYAVRVEGGYSDAAGRNYRLAFLGADVTGLDPEVPQQG